MTLQPAEFRLESLENRVTELEKLPARIDDLGSQVQQFRTEMHTEFSAVRGELATLEVRLESKLGARIDGVESRLGTQMRVLHEDVIGRIALLREARPAPRKARKKNQ